MELTELNELAELKNDLLYSPTLSPETTEYIFSDTDFSSYNWEGLNDVGKMRELQDIENRLAEIEGREPISLELHEPNLFEKLRSKMGLGTVMGFYDPNTNSIHINADLLDNPEHIKDLIDTVAHEGIHAYQSACVNGTAFHDNPYEVEIWRENINDYKSASIYGYDIYRNQPIEGMAFAIGNTVSGSYQYA